VLPGETLRARPLDLLFVVDPRLALEPKRRALAAQLPSLLAELQLLPGGLPDLHVAVVSADLGAGGRPVPGCRGSGQDGLLTRAPNNTACRGIAQPFLSDAPGPSGTRERNFPGELTAALACITGVPPSECLFQQPFEAMRRALDGRHPENAGFLRDSAHLAVVFVSAADDCSVSDAAVYDLASGGVGDLLGPLSFRCTELGVTCDGAPLERTARRYMQCAPREGTYLHAPATYAAFLRALKPAGLPVVVAAIAGPAAPFAVGVEAAGAEAIPTLAPSCLDPAGLPALPGVRLGALASAFATTSASVCDGTLAAALTQTGWSLLDALLERPCNRPDAGPAPTGNFGAPLQPVGCAAARGASPAAILALMLVLLSRRRRS
jgi:hypothetical protein